MLTQGFRQGPSIVGPLFPYASHAIPNSWLGCGFKKLLFSYLFGEDSHFDSYFSIRLKTTNQLGHFFHDASRFVDTAPEI